MSDYTVETRPITVGEYQMLRATTNWHSIQDGQVEIALKQDLFSVVVSKEGKALGMGRVIGDGAVYFYIQDVIVHPEYRGMGIGKLLMQAIEKYLNKAIGHNAFVGLMAAKGVEGFYKSFGYETRQQDSPGMYKVLEKSIKKT